MILLLIVTVIIGWAIASNIHAQAEKRFQHDFEIMHQGISAELETYMALLRATAGFIAESDEVTVADFRAYASYIDFERNYPGLLGIGVTIKVPEGRTAKLETIMREQGHQNFSVWPAYEGEQYSVIFVEPLNKRNQAAIGYNMYSDETRRKSLIRARDTGLPAASGKVTLTQEIDKDVQAGFIISVPFYGVAPPPDSIERRRKEIKGFINAPIRVGNFFRNVLRREDPHIHIAVFETTNTKDRALLFMSPKYKESDKVVRKDLNVAGRTWTIAYAPVHSPLPDPATVTYLIILLVGFLVCLKIGWLVWLEERARLNVIASEQRLRRIIDHIAAFVGEVDRSGIVLEISESSLRIANLQREDVIGKKFWECYWWSYDPDVINRMNNAFADALSGINVRFDAVARVADDKRLTVDFMLSPVWDDEGNITHLIPSAIDVSERVAIERERAQAIERFELAKNISDIGVFDYDFISDKATWDARLREMWGFASFEEITYDKIFAGIHPDDAEQIKESIRQSMEPETGGEFWHEHRVVNRETGKIFYVEVSGLTFFDNSKPVRIVGIIIDITHRKKLELELSAENERKTRFLATLSHELRNPLAPISNAFALLGREAVPEEHKQELLEIGRKSVDHLVRLINDLLDISRITRGKIKLQKKIINLIEPLEEAIQESWPRIEEKRQKLTSSGLDQEITVNGDPARLRQIFSNILNNATKYTPAGSHINILCEATSEEVHIVISDDGPGIPEDTLDEIFEIFAQAHDLTTRTEQGLGIGLALVRELVEMHGGSVTATNQKEGTGAVFTVILPLEPGK